MPGMGMAGMGHACHMASGSVKLTLSTSRTRVFTSARAFTPYKQACRLCRTAVA